MIETLFKASYEKKPNGMYYCVSQESAAHEIKKVEMETYSVRASEFAEARMMQLPKAEHDSLAPMRTLPQGAVVIELGGGDGRFGFALMREGFHVVESDIAPGTVARVKEVAEKNGITNGEYAVIDAEDLPFKDASVDAVLMVATFHHLPDVNRALAEFARVLKVGGKVVLLREPASWQYSAFGWAYDVLRHVLRSRNHNHISHADDETHGFTRAKVYSLMGKYFEQVELVPVQYVEKIYLQYVVLKGKFLKKEFEPAAWICAPLQMIDAVIKKIPLLKNTTWDWDIIATKKS